MCAATDPKCREEYQGRKSAVDRSAKGKAKVDTKTQSKKLFKELNLERTKRAMKQPLVAAATQPVKTIRVGKTVKKSEMNKPAPTNTPIQSASSNYQQILAKGREELKRVSRRGKSIAKASFEGID
jgi:phenylalanyl-tRNA synthetase alpha subunit